ncbi:MAG: LamG domain-containing protein [Planctomycetes bacterium]|nr:LamG domain-containing protein [Planctomycetota bacterium]
MCRKLIYFVSVILLLGSVVQAADIQWTNLGEDHLWSNPENWDPNRVPTLDDEVLIDVPNASAPNGPVIQDGIDAKAKGIFTEAPGEPTLTITGGTLEVAEWIWLGDGADSFGIWDMSGGALTVGSEFELGWGGGAGTLTMTGGTISAAEAVIPTGSGAFGLLYLYGGTYNVTTADGLSVKDNGMVDITEGTLILEGNDIAKVNGLIDAGLIIAYGGGGKVISDFDGRNPGKTTLTAVNKVVVLSEDFEGLPLGPNVDEALAGELVWTDTPPAGWEVDDSNVPGIGDPNTDGVTEWAGWAFADKAWWTETAGDQDRSLFELGSGTVAVADPDEWDDADHADSEASGWYKTFLTTPEIGVFGLEALTLTFDSSWRPEFDSNYHQTANITASFDGGEPVEVLLWESDESSDNYKPYATNETVMVNLDAPAGAEKVVLTFGLFDAGNDWWWAIDNVEVSGMPIPEPVDPGTDNLVAFYALDGDAADSSGNELHGAIAGEPNFVGGQIGQAMELDGVDDYVDINNPTLLDFGTGDFTISAWVNLTTTERATVYANGGDDGGGVRYTLAMGEGNDNKMTLTTDDDDNKRQAKGDTVVNDGVWHHVVGMRSGDTSLVYVDGAKDATQDLPEGYDLSGTTQHNAYLGAITSNSDGSLIKFFTGLLDEVAIYSRALSAGEISYLLGNRKFTLDGDTLDGLDHDNSVDKWDGSAPGEGNPGGIAALTEDDVTYIRVQDTGDPRDYGDSVPTGKTNFSLYLTQSIGSDLGLDGVRIELRTRIATSGTLDAWRKDGGGMASTGLTSWPAGGLGGSFENGTHEDYGRGNIGIAEKGKGVISFSLSTSGLMVGNSGNKVSVDDATQWNTFVIEIADSGSGKYSVSVSANGGDAQTFDVTPGTGVVEDGSYITIGSPDIAGRVATAFDVDYISITN